MRCKQAARLRLRMRGLLRIKMQNRHNLPRLIPTYHSPLDLDQRFRTLAGCLFRVRLGHSAILSRCPVCPKADAAPRSCASGKPLCRSACRQQRLGVAPRNGFEGSSAFPSVGACLRRWCCPNLGWGGLRGGLGHASQTANQQLWRGPDWPCVAPHRHGDSGGVHSVITFCSLAASCGDTACGGRTLRASI